MPPIVILPCHNRDFTLLQGVQEISSQQQTHDLSKQSRSGGIAQQNRPTAGRAPGGPRLPARPKGKHLMSALCGDDRTHQRHATAHSPFIKNTLFPSLDFEIQHILPSGTQRCMHLKQQR